MTVDLSLRDTGVCVYEDKETYDVVHYAGSHKSVVESGLTRFNTLECNSADAQNLISELILIYEEWKPSWVIVEMPDFSQSSKSAIAIGMLWGAIGRLRSLCNLILIEPQSLKQWSGSKRGDGKEEVKRKVLARTPLTDRQAKNNNIVDAVGIALMFADMYNNDYHPAI